MSIITDICIFYGSRDGQFCFIPHWVEQASAPCGTYQFLCRYILKQTNWVFMTWRPYKVVQNVLKQKYIAIIYQINNNHNSFAKCWRKVAPHGVEWSKSAFLSFNNLQYVYSEYKLRLNLYTHSKRQSDWLIPRNFVDLKLVLKT